MELTGGDLKDWFLDAVEYCMQGGCHVWMVLCEGAFELNTSPDFSVSGLDVSYSTPLAQHVDSFRV